MNKTNSAIEHFTLDIQHGFKNREPLEVHHMTKKRCGYMARALHTRVDLRMKIQALRALRNSL